MTTIALALLAFVSSNVDDFFLLTLWFLKRTSLKIVLFGQLAGFSALLLVSILGYLGTTLLPVQHVHWLGFLPVGIGVKQFLTRHKDENQPADNWWTVAAVAAAHGGDNIAVYVPLFARSTPSCVALTVACFYVMLALWITVTKLSAGTLAQNSSIHRFAHRVSPFVLVLIGVVILVS